jgi:Hexameric tyrosine-coordinated heme protein (HTHP)
MVVTRRGCEQAPGKGDMTQIPPEPLVPGNTLITASPEAGRALAILLARHSIHAMQKELELLKEGRAHYARDADGLIAAGHVIAVEFATIAAANNYWRNQGAAGA